MFRKILHILMFLGVPLSLIAQEAEQDNNPLNLQDDPILAMLDSMYTAKFFEASEFTTDTALLNVHKWPKDSMPVYGEAHYRKAMEQLDRESPFDFVYNGPVQAYIDAYTKRHRGKVSRMLGLAELYFPLFEETLDRYDLPMELKYLAIVESALNPTARSRSGAVGLWQFMYRTGKIYNLNSTSYLDDRRDPYLATKAACEYFRYLHDMFGDWQLVLAAYNGGPGNLLKAIRRAGGKRDYWEVRPFLRKETQGYVPAFFAVNYVMRHAADHNIYPEKPDFFSYEVDTVMVKKYTSLITLAAVLQMPYAQVRFLNPIYRLSVIPETNDGLPLVLPREKIGIFLSNQESIYELDEEKINDAYARQDDIMKDVRRIHTVRRGETLGGIAERYRVRVSELREWNGISGNLIREGQKLVLFTRSAAPTSSTSSSVVSSSSDGKYHIVRSGDTLWDIAKKNGISVQRLKELNNISNDYRLKIGTKLRVG